MWNHHSWVAVDKRSSKGFIFLFLRRLHESTLGGWCAMEEDDDPYLQIDLGKQKVITAVATQGLNNPQGNWVERYSLNYSCDGINWKTYQSFAKDEVNANYKL